MSRIAALYDIHGNLPALEAVLADVRAAEVEQIVVGGDVLPGPMPSETLALLAAIEIPIEFIRGNGERVVLERVAGIESPEVPPPFRDIIRWNADALTVEQQQVVATWPATTCMTVDSLGRVLFCHATPQNDLDIVTPRTPEARLRAMFDEVDAALIVCGHIHIQFDRTIAGRRVVNAGSVGMPFMTRGAYWLLLDDDVQLRRTDYDYEAAAARVRATRYPRAEEFAANNILEPPSAEGMLEAYADAEVK
jgi:putative phosphoesterase